MIVEKRLKGIAYLKALSYYLSLLNRELDESHPKVHDYTDDFLDATRGKTNHEVGAHTGDEQNHADANAKVNEGSVSAGASAEGSAHHADLGNGWSSDVLHGSAKGNAELGYVGTNEKVEADGDIARFENKNSGTSVAIGHAHAEAGAGIGAGGAHATAGASADIFDVHQKFGNGHEVSVAAGVSSETGASIGPHHVGGPLSWGGS